MCARRRVATARRYNRRRWYDLIEEQAADLGLYLVGDGVGGRDVAW
jgi:hypothetical protein